jgi:hypothetical protein
LLSNYQIVDRNLLLHYQHGKLFSPGYCQHISNLFRPHLTMWGDGFQWHVCALFSFVSM